MVEIKNMERIYLADYDVHVKPYLTNAEIQTILNSIQNIDMWAEREDTKQMAVLMLATDIGMDKVNEIGIDAFINSGLMAEVQKTVKNYDKIDVAMAYHDSILRALNHLTKDMPDLLKPLQDRVKK